MGAPRHQLAEPLDVGWLENAACRNADPEIFFPTLTGHGDVYAEARAICAGCPVTVVCLEAAYTLGALDGCWGGLDPLERKRLRRSRQRDARRARGA